MPGDDLPFTDATNQRKRIPTTRLPICVLSGCHVNKIEKGTCLGITLTQQGIGGPNATLGPTIIGYLVFEYNGGGLDFI
jgi:hypothetical protein